MGNTGLVLYPIQEQLKNASNKITGTSFESWQLDVCTVQQQQHRSFNTLQGPNNLHLAFESKEQERPWPIWNTQNVRSGVAPTLQPYWLVVYSTALQNFRFYSVYLMFSQSTAATNVESIISLVNILKKEGHSCIPTLFSASHCNTSRKQASTHAISNVFIQPVFHLGYQFMQTNRLEISEESIRQWHGHIILINRIFLGSKLSLLFIQKSLHYWTCYWAISSLLLQWEQMYA